MGYFQMPEKVRFVPNYLPGMTQPAVLVQVSVESVDEAPVQDVAASLAAIVAAQFQLVDPPMLDVQDGRSGLASMLSVIAHFYMVILQRCAMVAFANPRLHANGSAAASMLLPCARGDQQAVGAVVKWLLGTANQVIARQPLKSKADELAVLAGKLARQSPPGLNTIRFLEAAHARGIPFQRIGDTTYQYGWGARARLFDSSFTDVTPTIASNLARDKFVTANLLRRAGLPVPAHQFVANESEAVAVATRLGYPVVVKPSNLDGGVGVFAGLETEAEVIAAFRAARQSSKKILVERHFHGNDYRLQVLDGQVFWAVHRVPGGVVGDGTSTISQLLEAVNADPARGPRGSSALLKCIDLDEEAHALLSRQGLSPESVPAADQFVRLRRAANVASGGRPVPVLEEAHPDNLELAQRAARLLRLDLAGIDLLIPDIRRSWVESGAAICEVNAQPQLSPHLPGMILDRLVDRQGRIPTVLVIGSRQAAAAGLAVASRISALGLVTGFASRQLSFIGSRSSRVDAGGALQAGEALLLDPRVQVAVLCLDDVEWVRHGLPFDQCDALMLVGDPSAFVGMEGDRQQVHALAHACRGPVYCELPPESWGLAAGPKVRTGDRGAAVRDVTAMALAQWQDARSAALLPL